MTTKTRFTSILAAGLTVAALVPATAAASLAGSGSGDENAIVLPKQASAAEPFVAEVAPEIPAPITDDGFEWGDALIGAGVTLAGVAIVLAGGGALRSGRKRYPTPGSAASQGA